MSSKKNAAPRPFALVRELREMDDARRAATAANNVYSAYKSRAAATIAALGTWTEDAEGYPVEVARIGKTATLTRKITSHNVELVDEDAAALALNKGRAALEALRAADAADAISDTGDASREELAAAVEAYRKATAAALKALRGLPSDEALYVYEVKHRTAYKIEL